jgi:glycosyltransferase involved in cell wall biosynthesis
MRIAFIDPFEIISYLGGSHVSLLGIMHDLKKMGHTVTLLSPGNKGLLVKRTEERAIPVIAFPLPKLFDTRVNYRGKNYFNIFAALCDFAALALASFSLANRFRRNGFEIVHANQMVISIAAGIAARLSGIPCVWHIRENPSSSVPRIVIKLYAMLAKVLADRIIVNSKYTANVFRGSMIFEKISIVPIGIEEPVGVTTCFLRENLNRKIGISSSASVVSIYGRLIPMKGHDILIRALDILVSKKLDVHLLVAGHSPDNNPYVLYLQSMIRQLKLSDRVHFLGFVDNVNEVLSVSDVVVSASKEPETFGRTLIEAMALSKPVIATTTGAQTEIVRDGVTGYLVQPGCPEELASRLEELILSRELALRMGNAGRARYRSEYTLDVSIKRLVGIYKELLGTAHPIVKKKDGFV